MGPGEPSLAFLRVLGGLCEIKVYVFLAEGAEHAETRYRGVTRHFPLRPESFDLGINAGIVQCSTY